MTRHLFAMSLAVFLFSACGGTKVAPGDGGTNVPGPAGALCSSTAPCPSGQFCFNGLCALGCNSNGDCAQSQYCDTGTYGDRLCHSQDVAACPATACAADQSCTGGLCSTPTATTSCDPHAVWTGNDGCDKSSLCFDGDSAARCNQFPACAADGTCPVGTVGALCNDNLIPNKAKICLPSLCKRTASGGKSSPNCPSAWSCVLPAANASVGICSSGANLTPCNDTADCTSGKCAKAASSDVQGYCTDGKQGSFCGAGTDCLSGTCATTTGSLGSCL